MDGTSRRARIFSLSEAHDLLPAVKALTADAVQDATDLTAELEAISLEAEGFPIDKERQRIGEELNQVIARWAGQIDELGPEAKGLWLVDFDTGSGFYCWRYPEEAVSHFHGYDDGFAGRMKIV